MPTNSNTISPAIEYFDTLRQMPEDLSDDGKYGVIDRVFHLAVDTRLKESRIRFAGFFAKVDYLLKENAVRLPDSSLPTAVNDLRVRLRQRGGKPSKTKNTLEAKDTNRNDVAHDISVLCVFIGLIYNVEVPSDLLRKYPYVIRKDYKPLIEKGRTLRVIVISADEKFIKATREDSGDSCVIAYSGVWQDSSIDRSYLRKLLEPGMQLNLIRPRQDSDGTIYAEIIIVNPDCLIDISAIASCFDDYGDASPYTYLINKLRPKAISEPITLGNFASQLLDEIVYGRQSNFEESFTQFARHNALVLATCPVSDDFPVNSEKQRDNIVSAIETLKTQDTITNPSECILEPSFFCEPLGLQGRMDYLSLDYRVLIEQKSGRGAFNPDNQLIPRAKTPHYVQLLLYRAVLHYGGFNMGSIFAYLLYSKYEDSLLSVGNAPRLLFQALALRNQIAWMEMWLSRPGHFNMLTKITPQRICPQGHGYGWDHYTKPQLLEILDPIAKASPLERAYFMRFLLFCETEQVLSKLGNRTKEGSGLAASWNDSLAQRLAAGNIYDRLTMTDRHMNDSGQVDAVTLSFSKSTDTDVSNFREGDVVVFYSYDPNVENEPLVSRHIVFRGTLSELSEDHITISLRNPQTNGKVIRGEVWAVEHDFMESSSNSLYRCLHAFLSAPLSRRQLILNKRQPVVDTSITLNGDYTNFATGDDEFNTLVLRAKQARDFFLIIGPPGTGKTSYGMLNVLKEELTEPNSSILLMAYTNRAVDEMCQKAVDAGIDFIRIGSEAGCARRFRSHLLDHKAMQCESLEGIQQMIHDTRVFVGTTTAFNSNINLLEMKSFSLAIVDEASQILEPQLIGILSAKKNNQPSVGRFVLIGDEKQLPAVVQQSSEESVIEDESLRSVGITDCRMSLFERLMRTYRRDGKDNAYSYMLTRQGRMHPVIADFPNKEFYGGKLKVVPLEHQKGDMDFPGHLSFLTYSLPKDDQWTSELSDKVNIREAKIIADEVWKVYSSAPESFNPLQSVGVIVPYRNQVSTVRHAIEAIERRENVSGLSEITIDTVERYQGSQRDVIIYGFTVRRDYQLDFLTDNQYTDPTTGNIVDRKLNVAMTRAMSKLVIVGNPRILRKNPVFSRLLDYAAEHGVLTLLE